MGLKDTWTDKKDKIDSVSANDINRVARQAIENEDNIDELLKEVPKKANSSEVLTKVLITGSELNGTPEDALNGILPDYIYDGSIVMYRENYDEVDLIGANTPFESAVIFTFESAIGGASLGGERAYTQIAIAESTTNLLFTRFFSPIENPLVNAEWKAVLSYGEGGGSLAGGGEVDTELNVDSYNPIANSAVTMAINKMYAEIFDTVSFKWTDYAYTLPSDEYGTWGEVKDTEISTEGNENPLIIHCNGSYIGFTFSISGYGDAVITINGQTTVYSNKSNSGDIFAKDIVIPPTLMTDDIYIGGGNNTWSFTNMQSLLLKGVADAVKQIGDIGTALDAVIDIQNSLIGGDSV